MKNDEACNTGLHLGLGLVYGATQQAKKDDQKKPLTSFDVLCPKDHEPLNLGSSNLKSILMGHQEKRHSNDGTKKVIMNEDDVFDDHNDVNRSSSTSGRKKLKLTQEQSTFLESCFKLNANLDPSKKQALADQLNLNPRQVSVWFQNRRARTKLKQTEEEHELLKKYCESLSYENRKLRKELQELRSLKAESYCSTELRIGQLHDTTTSTTTTTTSNLMTSSTDKANQPIAFFPQTK